jgi:hypothetical protein
MEAAEHSLESPGDHSSQGPRATGLGSPYAGGVGTAANVGETADKNVPKRTTWEEDIRGSRNEQGMVSSLQRGMMAAKMSRAR